MRKALCIIITLLIIGALLIGTNELPPFGNPDNPEHNALSKGYIQNAMQDTGAKNIVSAVILDYRALDTFIETTVLFSGVIVVMTVLKES